LYPIQVIASTPMPQVESGSRRARQAAQTRRDILNAARRLFAEKGYAATSVAEVAAAAGASVQTIYDSVGSKAQLVSGLNDLIDEEGGVAALAARIPSETDPRALVEIAVSITHNICKRCGDIIGAVYGAANVEPALAAVRDESRRRHREGIARLTGRLAELGAMRRDLERERATLVRTQVGRVVELELPNLRARVDITVARARSCRTAQPGTPRTS
jgi:AcrR family transcriptional regulator